MGRPISCGEWLKLLLGIVVVIYGITIFVCALIGIARSSPFKNWENQPTYPRKHFSPPNWSDQLEGSAPEVIFEKNYPRQPGKE